MLKRAMLVAVAMLASGCGSDQQQEVSTGGIWEGSLNNNSGGFFPSDQLAGVIEENGNGYIVDLGNLGSPTPALYRLVSQPEDGGSQLSGAFTIFALNGQAFPSGDFVDTGTLTGTLYPRNFVTGSVLLADATAKSQGYILSFDNLYLSPAPFAASAASYDTSIAATTGSDSGTLTVKADGSFSLVNGAGCTISGAFTVPDTHYNVYELKGSYACPDSAAIVLTGYAYYVPANPTAATPTLAMLNIEYDDGKTTAGFIAATQQVPATPE